MGTDNPAPNYTAKAVHFQTDRYEKNNLDGGSAGKVGIFSIWFKNTALTGGNNWLGEASGAGTDLLFSATNEFRVDIGPVDVRGLTVFTVDGLWHHVLTSWDLSVPEANYYRDGVDDKNIISIVDSTIDYTSIAWALGARAGLNSGNINADVAEYYFNTMDYLDFTVAGNRALFRTAEGKPAFLGTNGELPTGTSPLIYFNGDAATYNAGHNLGTGGDFAFEQGSVIDASSSPSD